MKPIAWIRPCESEGAVLEWDKPHSSDCADPTHLYHGSEVDARIAELTDEVERLKMSLAHIASMSDYMASDGYVQMYANSAIELPEPGLIARNALRDENT
jgi:uncharacterized small protein (DUF1192 family)